MRYLSRLTYLLLFFFFSSRRRHTRSLRDWSSDVCSSDLPSKGATVAECGRSLSAWMPLQHTGGTRVSPERVGEIGRASCRERVEISGVGGSLKKNKIMGDGARDWTRAEQGPRDTGSPDGA